MSDVLFLASPSHGHVVVMTAYGVDTTAWRPPANFIVRPYVPQGAILKHGPGYAARPSMHLKFGGAWVIATNTIQDANAAMDTIAASRARKADAAN